MTESLASDPEDLLAQCDWLRGLARRLVQDTHVAEDLVQETCMVALHKKPRDPSRLRQWLQGVLRNFAAEHHRRGIARENRELAAARREETASTFDLVEQVAVQRELVTAVLGLADPYRATLLLRFFRDMSQKEIARHQGISIATVNSRMTRALRLLREKLDRAHGGDRRTWLTALSPLMSIGGPRVFAIPNILLMNSSTKVALGAAVVLLFVGLSYFGGDGPGKASGKEVLHRGDRSRSSSSGGGGDSSGSRESVTRERMPGKRERKARTPLIAKGLVIDADGRPRDNTLIAFAANAGEAVRSDAHGRFELRAPIGAQADSRTDARRLITTEPGFTTLMHGVFHANAEVDPVVVVARALSLSGVVVDAEGQPIEGARLRVALPKDFETRISHNLEKSGVVGVETKSASDGRFSLGEVPAVPGSSLEVSKLPFDATKVDVPEHSDHALYVIMREPGTKSEPALLGRVLDPQRVGVEGATVAFGLTSTVTKAHGYFHIEMRRAGEPKLVRAVKAGFLPAKYEPDANEPWPEFLELRLPGAAMTIAGRVLDTDDNPLENARVWIADAEMFGLHGMFPMRTEALSAGATKPASPEIPTAVRDNPLKGGGNFMESLIPDGPDAAWYYVLTDASGRFRLPGLQQRAYTISAQHPTSMLRADEAGVEPGADVEIKLPKAGVYPVVAGTVLLEDGRPAAGIAILVMSRVMAAEARIPGGNLRGEYILQGPRTRTDDKGRFRLENVARQDTRLVCIHDSILPLRRRLATLSNHDSLSLQVRGRCRFEVVLEEPVDRADTIAAEDENGRQLHLTRFSFGTDETSNEMKLIAGRSGVLVTSSSMRTLVLMKSGKVVARIPARLDWGAKTVLRH